MKESLAQPMKQKSFAKKASYRHDQTTDRGTGFKVQFINCRDMLQLSWICVKYKFLKFNYAME